MISDSALCYCSSLTELDYGVDIQSQWVADEGKTSWCLLEAAVMA